MGQQTTTIATVRFFRQDDKPPSAPDGATWVTPVDGAGNDTSSRYNYDAAAERWELDSAVGPSEPSLGVPVAGATWRDTANGTANQYDGAKFVNLGVTNHANLENVTPGQHFHPRTEIASIQMETVITDSSRYSAGVNQLVHNYGAIDSDSYRVALRLTADYEQNAVLEYRVLVGGSTWKLTPTQDGTTGSFQTLTLSGYVTVNPGDELVIETENNSGAVENLELEANRLI